jgi:hypothetical protein
MNRRRAADTGAVMRSASGLLAALAAGALLFPQTAVPASRPAPWATVNLCDPADHPGSMGVRVGVPPGPGAQWVRVRAEWYDARTRDWSLAPGGDGGWLRLGDGSEGVQHVHVPGARSGQGPAAARRRQRSVAPRQDGAARAQGPHERGSREGRRRPLVGAVRRAGLAPLGSPFTRERWLRYHPARN